MSLRFGDFELDPESYELRRGGEPVHCEPRVLEVLSYLVEHRGRVVTKEELLAEIWPHEFVSEAALSSAVRDARRALGDTGATRRWIETVHGRGFRFRGEDAAERALVVGARVAAPATSGAPLEPSIAVLPLEDLSAEEGAGFFADGMTDALITELAKIGSLRVVSRTSSLRYKGAREALPEVGRALGVQLVVEGTVMRVGDRVRITVQLIRTTTDAHLWAESYERELRDVLRLQSEVAQAIAREIDVELTAHEARRFAQRRQVEPDVYLLVLEGRHGIAQRHEAGFRRAVTCFERAAALDSTYAPAHAGLAEAYSMLGNYGILRPAEAEAPARQAIARALALDPGSADAHRTLALLHWQFAFDWEAAEAEYQHALALDPGSPIVRWWRGTCLGIQGRFGESLEELQRALVVDPLSLHVIALVGWMHYFSGRSREAVPYYRSVLAVDAHHLMAHWFLGQAQVEQGRYPEGIAELETALALSGRASRFLGYLGYAYGRAGRGEEARALLAELAARGREGYVPAYFPALVQAGLGNRAAALDELERAWAERDTMLRDLRVDPPWACLHREPRYRALLGRLRLWRERDSWRLP
jgi:TolB-like protein/Flp pilus assembly protein TadD